MLTFWQNIKKESRKVISVPHSATSENPNKHSQSSVKERRFSINWPTNKKHNSNHSRKISKPKQLRQNKKMTKSLNKRFLMLKPYLELRFRMIIWRLSLRNHPFWMRSNLTRVVLRGSWLKSRLLWCKNLRHSQSREKLSVSILLRLSRIWRTTSIWRVRLIQL